MLAFREAVGTIGVDIIESDLYLTKDGYLVYNHDDYVDETCNINGDISLDEVKTLCEDEANRHYICDMTLAELEQYGYRPAMERVERNLKLLDDMNAIFEENGLPKLEPRAALGGADSAQITSAGIPCLDSIGVKGGFGHNPNEYAIIESLRDSAKRLAAYIYCI